MLRKKEINMERLAFESLQTKLLSSLKDYKARAILGPIIHEMPDDLYEAAIRYLERGEEIEVKEGRTDTTLIMKHMKTSYLEALVIIYNLRRYPTKDYYIMHFMRRE